VVASTLVLAALLVLPHPAADAASDRPPDVVLVVTDDQRWDTLEAMPAVTRHLVGHGVTFPEAFVVNPLCCPSRTSILTGRYSHSTGVYRQAPPFGRFEAFDDSSTLATWLDDAGYTTAMLGKYVDGGQSMLLAGYVPPGWDRWLAFVHADYRDFRLSRDGTIETYEDAYSTDVLADEAVRIVHEAHGPLFLLFAPAAPHEPATPAPRHLAAPVDDIAARPPSFDEEDVSDKPPWVRSLPRLTDEQVAAIDALRVAQTRSLLAVDEAVDRIVGALRQTGRLRDTLIVFTSDNGLAWGEHRWTRKEAPYEESIRVPLVVRFDRLVAAPRLDRRLALNIDLAPTIVALAGSDPASSDGRSLVAALRDAPGAWRRDFLIEHLQGANPVTTYCAVRSTTHLYVEYRDGSIELYDVENDPFQLDNRAGDPSVAGIRRSMAARLAVLCDPPPPDVAPIGPVPDRPSPWLPLAMGSALAVTGLGVVLGRRRQRHRASAPSSPAGTPPTMVP
jgi:N-acetylglucosamine-6-sulfatase